MPVDCYVDEARDVLVLRGEGDVTPAECINSFDEIIAKTDGAALLLPALFILDDHASVNELDLNALMRMKSNVEQWKQKYPGPVVRSAFIATDSLRDPVAPLWKALTDANPGIGTEVRIFDTEAAAIAWLKAS